MKRKNFFILLLTFISLSSCNLNGNVSSSENISTTESTVENSSTIESTPDSSSTILDSTSTEGSSSISESEQINTDSSEEVSLLDQYWTNEDYGNYYQSIDLNNPNLLSQLQQLNKEERTFTVGYKNMWTYYGKTDYDPEDTSKVLAYYNNTSSTRANMNREHVWPNSRGGNLVENDIHTIRPTLTSDNSSRGNSFYVEGKNSSSSGWDPKTAGLVERFRGDAARIIFYCVVAESSLKLVDLENDSTGNKSMGKLSDLLKWNLQYPVSQSELNRNNGAEKIQGNRNPFIDNPGFACAIWGDTNDSTRKICSGSYVPEKPEEDEKEDDTIKPNPDEYTNNWVLVNNINEINVGDKIVIADSKNKAVAGNLSSAYLSSLEATFSSDNKYINSLPSDALQLTLGKDGNYWTLSNNKQLLGCTSVKKLSYDSGTTTWNISIDSGIATIESSNSSLGKFQYNDTHPRFTTYTSTLNNISIYKFVN